MPKKIENPLFGGLPAKIYVLCYIQPRSGYALANEIYGKPISDKIYKHFKKFGNYYEKTNDGYSVKIDQLLSEIQNILLEKNSKLDALEEKQLKKLLRSKEFKKYVGGFYKRFEHKIEFTEDGENSRKIKQDFSAIKLITETIGMVSTLYYINKKFKNKSAEIDVDKQEKMYKASFPNWKDLTEGILQFNSVLPFFKTIKEKTIKKLNTLWYASNSIVVKEYIDYWDETSEIICPKCSYKIKRRSKI